MSQDSEKTRRIIPARLTEIRQARGINGSELAEELGVTRQAVSRYELGHVKPSPEILSSICKILGIEQSFLTSKPVRSTEVESPIFFKNLQKEYRIIREVSAVKKLWFSDIIDFLNQFIDFPDLNLPDPAEFFDKDVYSNDEIEEAATLCRKVWALGDSPISDVGLLFENNGIILSRVCFARKKTDTFSFWHEGRPMIMLGSGTDVAVQRADLAHELGHIVLHKIFTAEQVRDRTISARLEAEANRFASAFLLPASSFAHEIVSTTLGHFAELKKKWNVPILTMVLRCRDLGILDDDQVLSLRRQLALFTRKHVSKDNSSHIEGPRLVPRAIEMLLDQKVKDPAELIRAIGVPPDDLEELSALPRNRLRHEGQIIPVDFRLKSA